MAITTKPKAIKQTDETEVQKLIQKGGSVATVGKQDEIKYTTVLVRLPVDMLAEIDASVRQRLPVRISRQAWMIETFQERLKRDD